MFNITSCIFMMMKQNPSQNPLPKVQKNPKNNIPPRNLTWNPKRSPWKRRFLLETIIFRFHAKFRESIFKKKHNESSLHISFPTKTKQIDAFSNQQIHTWTDSGVRISVKTWDGVPVARAGAAFFLLVA